MADLDVSGYVSTMLGNFAGEAVKDRFDDARDNAESAFNRALSYITDMQLVGNETYTPNIQQPDDVSEPDLNARDITAPTAPDTTMADIVPPESITLEDITVDRVSGYPTMTVDELLADLIVPINTFDFSEENYTTDLLDATKAKLQSDIENGATGLGPEVEADIWDRNLERDEQALQDAKDRITAEWAERGFDLPDGVLAAQIQELEKQYTDTRLTTSRDIAIKQAELAQQNTQFAVTQAANIEGQLLNFENARRERLLKAANDRIDNSIKIFDAAIKNITVRLDMYTRLLEEIKIEADINTKTAEVESEIQKNRAVVYSAEVDAFKARNEAEKVRIQAINEAFQGKVELFKAATQADASRIESLTKAFAARIQKAVSMGEIYVKEAEIELSAYTENQKLKAALVEAAAKVAAQLAASAYASTQASISLGESDGKHAEVRTSKDYNESETITHHFGQTTTTSTSTDTNYNHNYSE